MNRRELFKGIGAAFLGGVAAKLGVEATRTITFMDYSAGSSAECDVVLSDDVAWSTDSGGFLVPEWITESEEFRAYLRGERRKV